MPGESGPTRRLQPVEELRLAPDAPPAPPPARWRRVLSLMLRGILPLVILAVGLSYAWRVYQSAPTASRTAPARIPALVEVVEVRPALRGPLIEAWGEVVPERTLILRPEIAGRVVEVSPRLAQGEIVRAGEVLVRLDDARLRHALAAAEAEIRRIEARIEIERGQQERARRDLARLGNDLSEAQRRLVLRVPQMEEIEAELAKARAARNEVLVDLARTRLAAPFDAVVISEQVAVGTALTVGAEVATLAPLDRFRVVLSVAPAAIDWLIPVEGRKVALTQPGVWPAGVKREGGIERLGPGLTPTGRMAELIVAIDDPLALGPEHRNLPPVLLGGFLRGEIEGRPVPGAVALDSALLREGGTVWVMTPDDRLEVRPVRVAWRDHRRVLITEGLRPGERVVATPLAVVAPGMALRVAGADAGAGAER